MFSTVLQPTSEILGSFSPSSKVHKTLVASENIPRSVRTRTFNDTKNKKKHEHLHRKKFTKYKTVRGLTEFFNSEMAFSNSKQSFGFYPDFWTFAYVLPPPPWFYRNNKMLSTVTILKMRNFSCNNVFYFCLISVSFSSERLHFQKVMPHLQNSHIHRSLKVTWHVRREVQTQGDQRKNLVTKEKQRNIWPTIEQTAGKEKRCTAGHAIYKMGKQYMKTHITISKMTFT